MKIQQDNGKNRGNFQKISTIFRYCLEQSK